MPCTSSWGSGRDWIGRTYASGRRPSGSQILSKTCCTRPKNCNPRQALAECSDRALRSCKLLQKPLALAQGALAISQRTLVRPILHLDAHRAVVAGVSQGREQRPPAHIAQARDLRRVPAQAEHAFAVKAIGI